MSSMESTKVGTGALAALAARDRAGSHGVRIGVGIAAFVVATALSAYVVVPWVPVPMTLQPLLVVLAGALLGPWAGAAAMTENLAVGAAGAPVFSAGHAGLPWLMGPTGGYLLAYPVAAFAVGVLAGGEKADAGGLVGSARLLGALLAGIALIYLGGVSQLWVLTRQDVAWLLAAGVTPFVVGDVTKALIAFVVVRLTRGSRGTGSAESSGSR